jgi:hypothetical protein
MIMQRQQSGHHGTSGGADVQVSGTEQITQKEVQQSFEKGENAIQ